MFAKSAVLVLAVAACLIMGSAVANAERPCNPQINAYLVAEAGQCTADIPDERFYSPSFLATLCVSRELAKASCALSQVPEYMEACLEPMYISDRAVAKAKACMQEAVAIFL